MIDRARVYVQQTNAMIIFCLFYFCYIDNQFDEQNRHDGKRQKNDICATHRDDQRKETHRFAFFLSSSLLTQVDNRSLL